MKTIIRKPDLDTCLAGLILGCDRPDSPVSQVRGIAGPAHLNNPDIICIECGGSGEIARNNYDHHDPEQNLPPACYQAWVARGESAAYEKLVHYVSLIDDALPFDRKPEFPTLSHIFSGMLLSTQDDPVRYAWGCSILRQVVRLNLDPFSRMPDLPAWRSFRDRKKKALCDTNAQRVQITTMTGHGGIRIGYFTSSRPGGIGAGYQRGCDVVIACNPCHGALGLRKYTIASLKYRVATLLPGLNSLEKGWGGRSRIIGSPFPGSGIEPRELVRFVVHYLR